MTFVLASNNEDKLRELRAILSALGFDVISQAEAGVELEVEETGETFYDNARLKAEAAMRISGMPAIADDSGLMVDALGGAPGVWSKRYGGGLDDAGRNALLIKNMDADDTGREHRDARFVSSIVCVFPDGGVVAAEGMCEGTILHEPRGTGGFGYDPVFLVKAMGRSMAELTPGEKNSVSHRGNALRLFAPKLREYLLRTGEISC